jgi:hypothetical protein
MGAQKTPVWAKNPQKTPRTAACSTITSVFFDPSIIYLFDCGAFFAQKAKFCCGL